MSLLRSKTFLAVVGALVLLAAAAAYGGRARWSGPEARYAQYAAQVLEACTTAEHRPSCYDREIPKLMDTLSLADAFTVTRLVQEKDSGYPFCHVLGHELAARETKKDPSQWKDIIHRCPSGTCSNGCIHGAFQERFRAESLPPDKVAELLPELTDACEAKADWNPTGLEQATCYHALGHLTMYIVSADIHTATSLCEKISLKPDGRDYRQVCYDGAFMQIFQPLEPEDFALVKNIGPKHQDDLAPFCRQFTGARKVSCLREGWPLFGREVRTPEGLMKFCSLFDAQFRRACFSGMFYVLAVQFNFDDRVIKDFCLGLPDPERGQCFAGTASRFIETDYRLIDRSVAFCRAAEALGVAEDCYKELLFYSTFNFRPDSPDFQRLCERLPEPWKTKCLDREPVTDFRG